LIYGNGEQSRDYTYIDDIVNAYTLIFNSPDKLLGRAVNFGSGGDITINNLANMIIKLCGMSGKFELVHVAARPGEVSQLFADISLANRMLGYKPEYSLERGLAELIEWYRQGKFEVWRAYTSQLGGVQNVDTAKSSEYKQG
jgi:UDP-glucose 4-epimerase